MYLLLPIIVTSILLIIMSFFSTCLIAIHKRVHSLISMLTGVIILSIFVTPVTKSFGMLGTVHIFSISLGLIIFLQILFLFKSIFLHNNDYGY